MIDTMGVASAPVCTTSCSATPLPGAPACVAGRTCDPYLTDCRSMPSTGADDGAACTANAECRSATCYGETNTTGAPTGWLGGYCLSYGRFPSLDSFQLGQPLPQSTCPPGSVIHPDMTANEGDSIVCVHGCMADTDCRAGYACQGLHQDSGAVAFTVGFCSPADCTQPGRSCPTGYACQILPSAMDGYGSCVSTSSGDGGVSHDGGA